MIRLTALTAVCLLNVSWTGMGDAQDHRANQMSELIRTDFSDKQHAWEFLDSGSWRFEQKEDTARLSLFQKASDYQPTVRSPLHVALLKDVIVTDFQIDVRVKSTHADYAHRDVCLFFGYQSPTEFYYVHFGKVTDPHANQIFIVNNRDRTKISLQTNEGTPWDDQWHQLRVTRQSQTGEIQVYFDDMQTPVMTARDTTFSSGRVGLGSFDDTADFTDFVLSGVKSQTSDR